MEELKECYVLMLTTTGASQIGLNEDGKPMFSKELGFGEGLFDVKNNFKHRPIHIYITSNEGQIIDGETSHILICEVFDHTPIKVVTVTSKREALNYSYAKIIASTDPELGLPKMSDLLLTEFHLNGVPEKIMVKYNGNNPVLFADVETTGLNSISTVSFTPTIMTEPVQKTWTYEELQLIATRFAHQCRLKGITTNFDTVNLFKEWAKNNIYFKP
jgi:hypothetical protein